MSAKKKNTNTRSKKKGGKKETKAKFQSITKRAGLSLPVPRIKRNIKLGKYASRIDKSAPIFLTAVIEYLVAEVLELSGNAAKDQKKKTINPRHIMLAIRMDDELNRVCPRDKVIFTKCGTLCEIHPALTKNTKKKKYKKKKKSSMSDDEGGDYSQHF